MKRITSPDFLTSSRVFLMRSSNSPRYLVPATMPLRSRERMRLSSRSSGTSPRTIFRARPSARAVLPTPGSPMRQGLFLVRRERIWIIRWISSSRPMTGSSLPARASAVRSRVNSRRFLPLPPSSRAAPAALASPALPLGCSLSLRIRALYRFRASTPAVRRMRTAMLLPSRRMPASRCSVPI